MHVALAAAAAGARLVHVSSDAVFSGAAPSYDETRQPDPVTPYGAAKAAAETAVKGVTPDAVIARTSLIIGDGDFQHERLVHALASGAAAGVLFTDEVRCPVHVTDLARPADLPPHRRRSPPRRRRRCRQPLRARRADRARDGLDQAALPAGPRATTGRPGPVTCGWTRQDPGALATRLRGARDFLRARPAAQGHPGSERG